MLGGADALRRPRVEKVEDIPREGAKNLYEGLVKGRLEDRDVELPLKKTFKAKMGVMPELLDIGHTAKTTSRFMDGSLGLTSCDALVSAPSDCMSLGARAEIAATFPVSCLNLTEAGLARDCAQGHILYPIVAVLEIEGEQRDGARLVSVNDSLDDLDRADVAAELGIDAAGVRRELVSDLLELGLARTAEREGFILDVMRESDYMPYIPDDTAHDLAEQGSLGIDRLGRRAPVGASPEDLLSLQQDLECMSGRVRDISGVGWYEEAMGKCGKERGEAGARDEGKRCPRARGRRRPRTLRAPDVRARRAQPVSEGRTEKEEQGE